MTIAATRIAAAAAADAGAPDLSRRGLRTWVEKSLAHSRRNDCHDAGREEHHQTEESDSRRPAQRQHPLCIAGEGYRDFGFSFGSVQPHLGDHRSVAP